MPIMQHDKASYHTAMLIYRMAELLAPELIEKSSNLSCSINWLQLQAKGAKIEIYIARGVDESRSSRGVKIDFETLPYRLYVSAKRSGQKVLFLHPDGYFEPGTLMVNSRDKNCGYGPLLGIPLAHDLGTVNYQDVACDLAEVVHKAVTECLLVYRRYTPGLHDVCKRCPRQLKCAADTRAARVPKLKKVKP